MIIAFATWIGLIVGVAVGGGGISIAHITALAVQLAFFGFATGAVALALGAGTGRRSLATGVAAAVAILGWLINSFAPLVSAIAWLKYLSLFYYYAGHDPLTRGVDIAGIDRPRRRHPRCSPQSPWSASNAATSAPEGESRRLATSVAAPVCGGSAASRGQLVDAR